MYNDIEEEKKPHKNSKRYLKKREAIFESKQKNEKPRYLNWTGNKLSSLICSKEMQW